MDPIYRKLVDFLKDNEVLAFAVLVETRGSTPQKCGAKAIFLQDGRVVGTLGGGCLEAETRQKALRSLETGQPFTFRAVLDDDFGWDDGLICGGAVQTFVQPNPRSQAVWRALLSDETSRQSKVLALIVTSPNCAEVGACTLFAGDQLIQSDPMPIELQHRLGQGAAEILAEHEPAPRLIKVSEKMSVYFEPILPNPRLVICGGGHVGCATAKLAAWCGFDVCVIDDRASFANKKRFPDAKTITVADPAEAMKDFQIDDDTYIIMATRGHKHDAVVLREVIHSQAAYIGMIGSKRKVRTIMEGFIEEGAATAEDFLRVHSPMGLAIRSVTVEEIAVSIVSELIAVRRGRLEVVSLSATAELAAKLMSKTSPPRSEHPSSSTTP